jgi:hypothetical protein
VHDKELRWDPGVQAARSGVERAPDGITFPPAFMETWRFEVNQLALTSPAILASGMYVQTERESGHEAD